MLSRLAREHAPPAAEIDGLMDLGGGTALFIRSPGMQALRDVLSERFLAMLTAQDRGEEEAAITVQNKVPRDAARSLQAMLGPALTRRPFRFAGFGLHIYRRPHWERIGVWKFTSQERA